MAMFSEDPIKLALDGVDWVAVSGPVEADPGLYATHIGFCMLGEHELTVYRLSTGERVFDANSVQEAFGDLGDDS